ncbi:GyrI-like domain-containing protein [Ruminococcus sp.]|uniref:GyrI-like domain-containing protein n=1 Tax=Ruminococcus sp. TaxID=41978 RepID=UPI0025F39E6D|nr:GyrI-like domain-containing protein [Ruminococcus sp.]
MAFDFKKEYKEFYLPKNKPEIISVPVMNFISVRGKGDPNEEGGEYKKALEVLYAVAYTIKMSKMTDHRIDGYFDYVVPPLEGLWKQDGIVGIDYRRKSDFQWTAMIRLPDFVTESEFDWAVEQASFKKKLDCSKAEFMGYEEGVCVQCMHIGSYDDEPATVAAMDSFAESMGYDIDISDERPHHEIYLSDPRKTTSEKLKTVVRHPVKKRN